MTLYEKIQFLCRKNGFEISNLGEKVPGLSITRGSISGWKKGAKPRAAVIKAIADYFDVTPEYLMNDEISAPVPVSSHASDKVDLPNGTRERDAMPEVYCQYLKLDEIDRAKVEAYITGLLSSDKYR